MRRVAPLRVNGFVRPLLTLTLIVAGLGCQPDVSAEADPEPCSVETLADGTVLIRCPDGTEQTVEPQTGPPDSGEPLGFGPALDTVIDGPEALARFNDGRRPHLAGRVVLRGDLPDEVHLVHLQSAAAVVIEARSGLHTLGLPRLHTVGSLRISARGLRQLDAPRLAEAGHVQLLDSPQLAEVRLDALTTLDTLTLEITSGAHFSAAAVTRIDTIQLLGGAWRGAPHHLRFSALEALPGGLDLRAAGPVELDLSAVRRCGSVVVQGAPRTAVDLSAVEAIDGDLLLLTPGLRLALPQLTEVEGALSLIAGELDAPALERLDSLVVDGPGVQALRLPSLAEISTQAIIRHTALRTLTLPRLARLGVGPAVGTPRFDVLGNANLEALTLPTDARVGATESGPQIRVAGNYALCAPRMRLPEAEVLFNESGVCR